MSELRQPARAGSFYPASLKECSHQLSEYIDQAGDLPAIEGQPKGAIVPHAGWMCCGEVIGKVIRVFAEATPPDTVILFGAMHMMHCHDARLDPEGKWSTPLGEIEIDAELAAMLLKQVGNLAADPGAHVGEHSIEVIVPFLQHAFPECRIVPILMPPVPQAVKVGEQIADVLKERSTRCVVLGSTDLTHYGAAYGFAPKGCDQDGLDWAKNVNDQRIIEKMEALEAESIVAEAIDNRSACGAGAIAATMAVSRRLGASKGIVLQHTTSREVLGDRGFDGAVGYAGVVFA